MRCETGFLREAKGFENGGLESFVLSNPEHVMSLSDGAVFIRTLARVFRKRPVSGLVVG